MLEDEFRSPGPHEMPGALMLDCNPDPGEVMQEDAYRASKLQPDT